MIFDLDLIKEVYSRIPARIEAARKVQETPNSHRKNTVFPSYGR